MSSPGNPPPSGDLIGMADRATGDWERKAAQIRQREEAKRAMKEQRQRKGQGVGILRRLARKLRR